VTLLTAADWLACVRALAEVSPRLAAWAELATGQTQDALAAIGAGALPVMVVHGDFASWNVHYQSGRLAGFIDFGLTHLDTRPYELTAGNRLSQHSPCRSWFVWVPRTMPTPPNYQKGES
jgi:Ser/Thr protein kinase RdoA (MazF antagonist)